MNVCGERFLGFKPSPMNPDIKSVEVFTEYGVLIKISLPTQMLHFVDGERHKFVEVHIIDDATPEGPERFQLILSQPSPGLELGTNITGRTMEHKEI